MSVINENTKLVKAAEIFSLTSEILEQGGHAWITVTGMSMYPFLREDKDSVELSKASFSSIKKGDIVLIKRLDGVFVLHRVCRKEKDCFYMVGDAQQWIEGPLAPEQIQAKVTRIKKNGRVIDCKNPILRLCVSIWMLVTPFRYKIFKFARALKRIAFSISKKLFKLGIHS